MAAAIGVGATSFALAATPAQLGDAGQVFAYGVNTAEAHKAIAGTDRLPIVLAGNERGERAEAPHAEKAEPAHVEKAEAPHVEKAEAPHSEAAEPAGHDD